MKAKTDEDNLFKKKLNQKEEFDKWFDEYFCDQQGEDSPYGYSDVREAYKEGINICNQREQERIKKGVYNVAKELAKRDNEVFMEKKRLRKKIEDIIDEWITRHPKLLMRNDIGSLIEELKFDINKIWGMKDEKFNSK